MKVAVDDVRIGFRRLRWKPHRRDPALGSSVLLTFVTDAMRFLLFLGLASVFLD